MRLYWQSKDHVYKVALPAAVWKCADAVSSLSGITKTAASMGSRSRGVGS
jgi:hypothetical protein